MNSQTSGITQLQNDFNAPGMKALTWGYLFTRSYGLYRERFVSFFCMAIPSGVIALFWKYIEKQAVRELVRAGLMGTTSVGKLALLVATGWLNGAVYWTLSSFFFAAIASSILTPAEEGRPLLSDSFTQARARAGAVTIVALLAFTIIWLGQAAAGLALWNVMSRIPNYYGKVLTLGFVVLLLAGLLSRLGVAIPHLMNEPQASIGQALRTSLRSTENWEPFFMVFLAKSALAAWAVYSLAYYGLAQLWHRGALNATTYRLAEGLLLVTIAAALQTPLFIAFTLLYLGAESAPEQVVPAAIG